MKTLHVTGFKNSGKTALISHWITVLRSEGLEVAVLKHHGHGGAPELPPVHTDTVQFLEAGAVSTLVAGGNMIQLIQQKYQSFEELKTLTASNQPDVLLIEGYKQEVGEKIVLLRNEGDWEDLKQLQGIIRKAYTEDIFADISSLDEWILDWVQGGGGK
ncbi:molybdopterin-guanine dinucleotide biosynthesis protein B [Sporosarcina cascadiensis]|uniref:molybdopterin-guanine dinucleotide biosynthesis protein B n=1 Tax=Sporosarcina cascadiensis TaxID=2660747 RepID=UPI00129A3E91|nr:molybdopterin-guanine dinucleotide biosynthesis protein B [Sporosarcina cascadiensis]